MTCRRNLDGFDHDKACHCVQSLGIESQRGQQLRRPLAITKRSSAAGHVTGPVMAPRILDDMPT
jgi:hypothetical protein